MTCLKLCRWAVAKPRIVSRSLEIQASGLFMAYMAPASKKAQGGGEAVDMLDKQDVENLGPSTRRQLLVKDVRSK